MKSKSKLPLKKIKTLYSAGTAPIADPTTTVTDPTSTFPLTTTHIYNK